MPNLRLINLKFIAAIFITVATGCFTTKELTYFQGQIPASDSLVNRSKVVLIPGTTLYIQANSFGELVEGVHNPFQPMSADPVAPPPANAVGYMVKDDNTVDLPLVGTISVKDRTPKETAEVIRAGLGKYLKKPSVLVKLPSFNITVLGEVNKPGFYVYNYYEMSLPLALGLAGDLTTYARRDNILVVHKNGDKRTYGRLDLTSPSVFRSPFYNLYSGDVIYVSPSKTRSQSLDNSYRLLPIILSGISVLGTIILVLK